MDDAGFIKEGQARQADAARPLRRGRAMAGAGFALAVHVALISLLALGMGQPPVVAVYEEPVLTLTLAPQVQTPQPQTPPDQPPPKAVSRPEPPRFTPREVIAPAAAAIPPLVTRPPLPPEPSPPQPVAQAAPAAAAASAPSQASFQNMVLSKIERARRYPPAARARREEGVVTVAFVMTRGGKVTSANIVSGAGSTLLDREAIETVRRAQPLPPVPQEFEAPLRLVVRLEFFVN